MVWVFQGYEFSAWQSEVLGGQSFWDTWWCEFLGIWVFDIPNSLSFSGVWVFENSMIQVFGGLSFRDTWQSEFFRGLSLQDTWWSEFFGWGLSFQGQHYMYNSDPDIQNCVAKVLWVKVKTAAEWRNSGSMVDAYFQFKATGLSNFSKWNNAVSVALRCFGRTLLWTKHILSKKCGLYTGLHYIVGAVYSVLKWGEVRRIMTITQ